MTIFPILYILAGFTVQSYAGNELVWSDEFEEPGLPDKSKWSYDVGGHGWGNNELQFYTKDCPKNARVKNGHLIIEAHNESRGNNQYTSARLITKNKGDWLYGRIEVRAKLPKGVGTWPAIWMLPTDSEYGRWPKSGEIDIMEHVGFDMNIVHSSLHTYAGSGKNCETALVKVEKVDSQFHVYSLAWTPDTIQTFVDGQPVLQSKRGDKNWKFWPFDKKFYLILNIAIGGNWGGREGVDSSIWPQRMVIDYVRVYQISKT